MRLLIKCFPISQSHPFHCKKMYYFDSPRSLAFLFYMLNQTKRNIPFPHPNKPKSSPALGSSSVKVAAGWCGSQHRFLRKPCFVGTTSRVWDRNTERSCNNSASPWKDFCFLRYAWSGVFALWNVSIDSSLSSGQCAGRFWPGFIKNCSVTSESCSVCSCSNSWVS